MRISLGVWDMAYDDLAALAGAAESAGCHGIWLGDHVVVPGTYASHHPTSGSSGRHTGSDTRPLLGRRTELLDPLLALAGLAGVTRSLSLATGIYVLPLRHPLQVARSVITLQEVTGGRLRLGVGAGWLREEFELLDQRFEERGRRLDEQLAILELATLGGPFDFHGREYTFEDVQVAPRPIPVPVVHGGNSAVAMRRAARNGVEWFASGTPAPEEASQLRTSLLRLREELGVERPLSCIVRVAGRPTADVVNQYSAAGYDEIVLWADEVWTGDDLAQRQEHLRELVEELST